MATLYFLFMFIVVLSQCFSCYSHDKKAPLGQTPHYIDGVHQDDHEEGENEFMEHTCEDLIARFGAYYGRKESKAIYPYNALEDELAEKLNWMQYSPVEQCSQQRILLYKHHECGLGAELHWIMVALQAAMDTNRTLVLREDLPWLYADDENCDTNENGRFGCYFEPLSSCRVRNKAELMAILASDYQEVEDKNDEGEDDGIDGETGVPIFTTKDLHAHADARVVQFTDNLQKQLNPTYQRTVPKEWTTRYYSDASLRQSAHPLFWWRSQFSTFIFRPLEHLQLAATAAAERLHFLESSRMLAVHARRGDKVHGSPTNDVEMRDVGLSRPVLLAEAMATKCDFDGIFYSTRDPGLIEELQRRYGEEPGVETAAFPFIAYWDPLVHRYGKGHSTHVLSGGTINRTREAYDVIKDVLLMSDCGGFVGTMESNLSRLVHELAAALRTLRFTPIGIGEEWWRAFP